MKKCCRIYLNLIFMIKILLHKKVDNFIKTIDDEKIKMK